MTALKAFGLAVIFACAWFAGVMASLGGPWHRTRTEAGFPQADLGIYVVALALTLQEKVVVAKARETCFEKVRGERA